MRQLLSTAFGCIVTNMSDSENKVKADEQPQRVQLERVSVKKFSSYKEAKAAELVEAKKKPARTKVFRRSDQTYDLVVYGAKKGQENKVQKEVKPAKAQKRMSV